MLKLCPTKPSPNHTLSQIKEKSGSLENLITTIIARCPLDSKQQGSNKQYILEEMTDNYEGHIPGKWLIYCFSNLGFTS